MSDTKTLLLGYFTPLTDIPHFNRNIGTRPQKPYELPDGYNLNFGAERFKIPEI
ncbi:hypothetical protein BGZ98_008133, partial [Dissophora globulifera]